VGGPIRVLLVEDNPADAFIITDILTESAIVIEMAVVDDGEKALRHIDGIDSDSSLLCPDIVLLDLNLPKYTGHEVLSHIRHSVRCRHIPVLIVSSSRSPQEISRTQELGATGFFRKPATLAEYSKLGDLVKHILSGASAGAS
jgi:two-component system, chemotaxis family, response regulator Rcp1